MSILTQKSLSVIALTISFLSFDLHAQVDIRKNDKAVLPTNEAAKDPGNAPIIKDIANDTVDNCWLKVSSKYNIPTYLLFAVAMVESQLNPVAINKNTNGSVDYGYMQINNSWHPTLAKYNIKPTDLSNPCVSIHVGAWILADNFYRMGYSWKAIGAYNAKDPYKRWVYAQKVYAMHDMLVEWSHAYESAYVKQYGQKPPHAIKPPSNWITYAHKKAAFVIAKNKDMNNKLLN